eukprot:2420536-Ditylum_brightwellii.AAC.1
MQQPAIAYMLSNVITVQINYSLLQTKFPVSNTLLPTTATFLSPKRHQLYKSQIIQLLSTPTCYKYNTSTTYR